MVCHSWYERDKAINQTPFLMSADNEIFLPIGRINPLLDGVVVENNNLTAAWVVEMRLVHPPKGRRGILLPYCSSQQNHWITN
jgi:hypothetical protein